jgi:hypothetical protein
VYKIDVDFTYIVDVRGLAANHQDFISLIYYLYENNYYATIIENVNDLEVMTTIGLITDFSLIKKIDEI